jgi:hypothetical protein
VAPLAGASRSGAPPGSPDAQRIVGEVLRGSRIPALHSAPLSRTRSEQATRKVAKVAETEQTLGFLELASGAAVLFTEQAVYWTNQGSSVAVPYRAFAGRAFRPVAPNPTAAPSHVDFGDGLPRLTGTAAQDLADLLHAVRAALTS